MPLRPRFASTRCAPALVAAVALAACIDPPAPAAPRAARPSPAVVPEAPAAPATPPPPAAPAPSPTPAPAPEPVPSAPEPAALAAVRAWIDHTPAAAPFRGGSLAPAPEFDTAQVHCARVSVREAPDPLRASRVVCATESGEILAGEPGLQRHLQMHQFDPAMVAEPAAHVLLELRDAMLGLSGRVYTEVHSHVQGGALVIDARGAAKASTNAEPRPARWRVVITRDGNTREESLPVAAP